MYYAHKKTKNIYIPVAITVLDNSNADKKKHLLLYQCLFSVLNN